MARKSPEEKLAEKLKEEQQVKAERKQLEARVRANQKKAYDRKCYVLGDLMLRHGEPSQIADIVERNVTDPAIKKLFGL